MLIELDRAGTEGQISVNPDHVAAVVGSTYDPSVTIVKFADGRGFKVQGSYQDVMGRLNGSTAGEHLSAVADSGEGSGDED